MALPLITLAVVAVLNAFGIDPFAPEHTKSASPRTPCDTPDRGWVCNPDAKLWGQYSPFHSVPSPIDPLVPKGCSLTFAQILSRHGARDPTLSKSIAYAATIANIHETVTSYGYSYEFIKDYQYTLGADQLTAFGQQQMVNSGLESFRRYSSLAREALPFVRASGQERVVQSAVNWTMGFHQAGVDDQNFTTPNILPYDIVVIPEASNVNNTLSHKLCTAFESGPYHSIGSSAQSIYAARFTKDIAQRLNENLPGANFSTPEKVIAFMDLCPFNTVATPPEYPLDPISPFCGLFTTWEWQSYDYYQTLGKWYGFGPGNPLGPTQGVGFVNELIARLTGKAVADRTSTNATLDGDAATFPLNRALYADFSHDNDMTGILGALGLYDGVQPLSNTTRQDASDSGGYSASWTVPFAARINVEKMVCGAEVAGEELVRILVNDRVAPLKGCGADSEGRCTLSKFVDSLEFARRGGLWDLCFK
ncbi:3-phytase A [Podospora didyma]|uniref:Phytase A n=1 Tax=Podospora didyma TaxID=330526 RepID=A0AAE0U415_9PEZI|nr:3-phytase A [Podospora didyma]